MMKQQTVLLCVMVSVFFLVSGCANKSMEENQSGFLKSYDGLEKNSQFEASMVRIMPEADFSKYDNIMVAPVKIISHIPEAEQTAAQKSLYAEMSTYLTAGYILKLKENGSYTLVEHPGPKTMKLEVAISAVEVHFDDMEWYQFIPVTLAVTAGARATYVDKAVRILGEGRLIDAETDKVLLRVVDLQKGEEVGTEADEIVFADVKKALDVWLGRSVKNVRFLKEGLFH